MTLFLRVTWPWWLSSFRTFLRKQNSSEAWKEDSTTCSFLSTFLKSVYLMWSCLASVSHTFPSRMVSQVALFLLTGHSSISCIDTSYSPSNSCRRLHTSTQHRDYNETFSCVSGGDSLCVKWCELHLFLSKTVIWATNVVSPSSLIEELLLFLFTTSSVKSATHDKVTCVTTQCWGGFKLVLTTWSVTTTLHIIRKKTI